MLYIHRKGSPRLSSDIIIENRRDDLDNLDAHLSRRRTMKRAEAHSQFLQVSSDRSQCQGNFAGNSRPLADWHLWGGTCFSVLYVQEQFISGDRTYIFFLPIPPLCGIVAMTAAYLFSVLASGA